MPAARGTCCWPQQGIIALKDRTGSSIPAIKKWMATAYPEMKNDTVRAENPPCALRVLKVMYADTTGCCIMPLRAGI